jgi:hypothetical protein
LFSSHCLLFTVENRHTAMNATESYGESCGDARRASSNSPVVARRNGRWVKGVSGNPAGRPDGALTKKNLHVRQLLEVNAEAVIATVVQAALGGDMQACKMILDRIAPVPRDRPITVALPEIGDAETAMAALTTIVSAVSGGQVSPLEGESLSRLLRGSVELDMLRVLEARLAAVEQRAATA